jgi:hypothetical protein
MSVRSARRATTVLLTFSLLASAAGAAPRAVAADAARIVVPTWGAGRAEPGKLELVDPVGGGSQPFAAGSSPGVLLQWPSWSGDATRVAFWGGSTTRGVVIKPVDAGPETTFLPQDADHSSWSPVKDEIAYWLQMPNPIPGHVSWALKVRTADGLITRTVAGPYDAIVDMPGVGPEQPAWSPDGQSLTFAYRRGLVRVPAAGGSITTLVAGGADYLPESPSYSPDGKRLAYVKMFLGQFELTTRWQLVVRDLTSGAENVLVDEPSSIGGNTGVVLYHGPQSWSPDSKQIAYADQRIHVPQCPPPTFCPEDGADSLMVLDAAGGGGRAILQRPEVRTPAWARPRLPSYYIKHVEVTQAISPDLEPLLPFDPLLADPYTFNWTQPVAFGFPLPLIAEKSTLLRIYVGDASLPAGTTARRSIHFRIVDQDDPSITYEAKDGVDVTAPGVAPQQATAKAALNATLPPAAAQSGAPNSFVVEINVGSDEPECAGCWPNGNKAIVQGVRAAEGGNVVIVPVPIYEIKPNNGKTEHLDTMTVVKPDRPMFEDAVKEAVTMLPIRDDGLKFADPSGPGVLVRQADLTLSGGCRYLYEKLLVYRASAEVAGPVEGFGATRWVGYAPPVDLSAVTDRTKVCLGRGFGKNLVLRALDTNDFAHEFGHTFGLTHASGRSPTNVPPGGTALPYPGIGGVGYKVFPALGLGTVFDKSTTSDIMSYDASQWTSPRTWQFMYQQILAESGAIRPRAVTPRAASTTKAPVTRRLDATDNAPVTRRLVGGVVQGDKTVILDSLVTKAATPDASGPPAAIVVARDAHGRSLAQAPVRGTPEAEQGESRPSLPFVVALPDKKQIASLEVLPTGKGKPLALLRRSKHRPKGRWLKLPKRASAARQLTLRWRATDRDRRDTLSVLLLGRRGTGKWRTIALGPAAGSMKVDPKTLGTGNKLGLRMLVSDGLITTVVNARPIKLAGRR